MSKIVEEVMAANAEYVAGFGDKGAQPMPADIPIYGYIYGCGSGKLVEVPEASAAGRAS